MAVVKQDETFKEATGRKAMELFIRQERMLRRLVAVTGAQVVRYSPVTREEAERWHRR